MGARRPDRRKFLKAGVGRLLGAAGPSSTSTPTRPGRLRRRPGAFVAPAAGSAWQGWFEPAGGLSNPGATPHTGDFTDAYGNRMRVLAVANPKLTKVAFRAARRGRNAELGDRDRKREGYGLVR